VYDALYSVQFCTPTDLFCILFIRADDRITLGSVIVVRSAYTSDDGLPDVSMNSAMYALFDPVNCNNRFYEKKIR